MFTLFQESLTDTKPLFHTWSQFCSSSDRSGARFCTVHGSSYVHVPEKLEPDCKKKESHELKANR